MTFWPYKNHWNIYKKILDTYAKIVLCHRIFASILSHIIIKRVYLRVAGSHGMASITQLDDLYL